MTVAHQANALNQSCQSRNNYTDPGFNFLGNMLSGQTFGASLAGLSNAFVSPDQKRRRSAHAYAADVRARNPQMQVKKLTTPRS